MNLLQESRAPGHHIRRYSAREIVVGGTHYPRSLLLAADQLDAEWGPDRAEGLTLEHLEQLQARSPELILLGTGAQRALFTSSEQQRWLQRFPGMEVMDTGSACRTYNLLHSEGRNVVAGLILEN